MMRRKERCRGVRISRSGRSVPVLLIICLLAAGLFCTTVGAASLTVGDSGYATITDALDRAAPGDTILVESGTYHESITISVPVTVTGVDTGAGIPVIMATEGEAVVVLEAGGTTIEGLFITGSVPCGIFVHSDTNVITGNTITTAISETGVGICIYDADRTLVTKNHIEGQRVGIQIRESDGTLVYLNEIACTTGAISSSPETSWTAPAIAYEYAGTSFVGAIGNHWIRYEGTDSTGDGIGDEAYVVSPPTIIQVKAWQDEPGRGSFAGHKPSDLMDEITGGVIVEDTAPLVAGIEAYTLTETMDIPDVVQRPGQGPRSDEVASPFTFPREPGSLLWPVFAFLGSLVVAGILTVLDRRARHAKVLDRSRHTVPVLTAGYTILAVLFSSAMFLTGFQSMMVMGVMPVVNPVIVGLAFLSVAGVILGVTTTTERAPRYLLGTYLIVAGIVAVISAALILTGTGVAGGPGGYIPIVLCSTAVLLGLYHRSRFISVPVSGDTDERTRIIHEGDPFDETRIMDTQLRDVYFPATLSDRYREVTFIGKGGLARVFRAVRREDGAVVAVKVPISFDETTGRIFLKEMKLWEGLSHPNIVRICSVNILPVPYVEMEYVSRSLAGITMPLPPEEAAAIIEDIVHGLMYAHEHDIIHRDIKPHNILIAEDGTAKITDWGLGTVMGDGHESSIVGFSIQYAAPEQIAPRRYGDADTRTDIYQTGIVFYELLTGRRPFGDGGLGEMTDAILGEAPVPPSSRVPAAAPWDEIVMRCIAKEKDARYPTAEALEAALHAVSGVQ